jgi:hypothetical protein
VQEASVGTVNLERPVGAPQEIRPAATASTVASSGLVRMSRLRWPMIRQTFSSWM